MPKIPINDDDNEKLVRKVAHEAKKVAKNKIAAKKKGKNSKKVNYKEFQFSDNDDESQDSRGLLAFLEEDDKKRKEIKKKSWFRDQLRVKAGRSLLKSVLMMIMLKMIMMMMIVGVFNWINKYVCINY